MKQHKRAVAASVVLLTLVLGGCAPRAAPEPTLTPGGNSNPNIDVRNDVVYREIDGTELELDACLPKDDEPRPAVVLVHGGAFQEGDRATMLDTCEYLAEQGFAAFSVDYRLLPEAYPAQVEDVSAAVSWLRDPAQAAEFALDGDVSVLGSSAGAIIALSTSEALSLAGTPVSAVVGLSSAGDLRADPATLGTPPPDLEKVVLAYLGCVNADSCSVAAAASPITGVADLPRTMLIHGSEEIIPIQQAEVLTAALEASGVPHELIVIDGDNHGLQLMNDSTRPAIADFLRGGSSG